MPTSGNTLGPRSWYKYTDDGHSDHAVLLDDTTALAAGFTLADSPLPEMPKRSRMRVVFVEAVISGKKARKALVCPTVDSTLYAANVSQVVAIDGVNFYTTGRRGEKLTFPRYSSSVGVTP